MAFLDRSQIVRPADRAPSARGKELMVGVLLAALIATLAIRNLVPADALAPAIVTLLFAVGAATAGAACLCRTDRFRITWLDLAGSLTFIGVVISVLIEPDQLIRLCGVSDQTE
jgi:predicted small integral membrane protein